MRDIVGTDRVKVAHVAGILHGRSPGAEPCLCAVVHQARIGVSHPELQALTHASVKAGLECIVMACAVREITPVNLLILWPHP